jgi:proteic killer suppression protein
MINSFGNQLTKDLFEDKKSRIVSRFPSELIRAARRKLQYIDEADSLIDLKAPPGNRLEVLKGNLKGYFSIRINDKWRIIFKNESGSFYDVKICDYH